MFYLVCEFMGFIKKNVLVGTCPNSVNLGINCTFSLQYRF